MKKSIDIVIPVLDEEKQLSENVTELVDYLNTTELAGNYRIVIADNGSKDQTPVIGKRLQEHHPDVIKFIDVGGKGVGLAFRTAILESNRDAIGYMDLDLATDVSHIPEMYSKLCDGCEIVVGSRLLSDSEVHGRSAIREITSRGLNLIMKFYLGVRFSDAMCGFKFYDTDKAKELVQLSSDTDGWFYCAEMLVRAEWEGIPICEIPVKWTDDGNSKVKIGSLSLSYLKEIRSLKRELNSSNKRGGRL